MNYKKLVFFDSLSNDFTHPGDRRRFYGYAKKIKLNVSNKYTNETEIILLTQKSDLSKWAKYKKKKNKRIIFDLADAYLLEKKSMRRMMRGPIKFILGQNKYLNFSYINLIRKICSMSDAVICSTKEQRESILPYCKNVHIILDLQDDEILKTKQNYELKSKKIKILWEGMANNIKLFEDMSSVLKKFNKTNPFELHLVSDLDYQIGLGDFIKLKTEKVTKKIFKNSNNIFLHEWNAKLLNNLAVECDFAIIPSSKKYDDMFINKSANKLFFFWKMGLPVLTSFSYAYEEAKCKTNLNFICKNKEDWINKLILLSSNMHIRKENAMNGKLFCEHNYKDANVFNAWGNLFKSIDLNIV